MQEITLRRILHVLGIVAFTCLRNTAASFGEEPRAVKYLYAAKDIDPTLLKSDEHVVVTESAECWSFAPAKGKSSTVLLFFPGGGVDPTAYAPLVRAVASEGWSVQIVKLPGELKAPEKHRQHAITQGKTIIKSTPGVERWIVGGHSMGGAIAARFVHEEPKQFRGLILIGTTHPRDFDLSSYAGDVTKIYGTEDGVAKHSQNEANKKLLPVSTTWERVEGGNHAQFGTYGPQVGDGKTTISAETQRQVTCEAVVRALRRVSELRE